MVIKVLNDVITPLDAFLEDEMTLLGAISASDFMQVLDSPPKVPQSTCHALK